MEITDISPIQPFGPQKCVAVNINSRNTYYRSKKRFWFDYSRRAS